jgi:hypothetical protein
VSGRRFTLSRWTLALLAFGWILTAAPSARAQASYERSDGWDTVSRILAISSLTIETAMPRVFYSDPEVTVGWKARWHASVLASSMTLATLGLLNEALLKDAFKGFRPGCDESTPHWVEACDSYGMLSTPAFVSFSAFGQGTGVFLMDTIKWSHGRVNGGALFGHVGLPLILGVVSTVGRTAGNLETAGQAWGSAGIGAVFGLGMGLIYGAAQRPECGYTGGLFCW